jgi:hypothetical protein
MPARWGKTIGSNKLTWEPDLVGSCPTCQINRPSSVIQALGRIFACPGAGRARLRPSRGFPVGPAGTGEPNGEAAISTNCSDSNRRQLDWTRSPALANATGSHGFSLATANLAVNQITAVHLVGSSVLAKWLGSPGSGGASPSPFQSSSLSLSIVDEIPDQRLPASGKSPSRQRRLSRRFGFYFRF